MSEEEADSGKVAAWLGDEEYGAGSFTQGAALGAGTRWAGGLGLLVDGGGDDRYGALRFAQGAGMAGGLGVLSDHGGRDEYAAAAYAMGAGRGLGVGVLLEGGGDDVYRGGRGCVGAGEDLGLGMLVDGAGDDRYLVEGSSSASGAVSLRQGAGWLLDGAGSDAYPSGMLRVDPGVSEPWRAPVPGVCVFVDLEQPASWLPSGSEPRLLEDPNRTLMYLPWIGGPGSGGGLVVLAPGNPGNPVPPGSN